MDGDLAGFRQKFESFLDQCPSFIDYVGIGRFFPVFFFSMFATARNAQILDADEKVYFRFDNHGIDTNGDNRNTENLKVAVLTNKFHGEKRIVRCYSISDVPNSDGLRFSTREKNALVREIRRQNPNLGEQDLSFEQYKVCMHGKGKSQGEKGAVVFEAVREKDFEGRVRFAKYSASEVSLLRHIELDRFMEIDELAPHGVPTIKEIERMQLDQDQFRQLDELVDFAQIAPGQQRIGDFIEMLASNNEGNIRRTMRREILPYITRIHRHYADRQENDNQDRYQKFESHGFLLGFLANFSHRYTIGIDLDLSPRNSHVAFLVHHQAERGNVPIVVNLATRASSNIALNRARSHAERLHVFSFIPINTESRNTVCVGLNFNLNRIPFRVDTVELQQDRFSLVRRLFECVENEEIIENIKDFLLQHIPTEIPINEENRDRILDCITGFAFGNSAFDNGYVPVQRNRKRSRLQATKHIFRYDDPDLRRCLTMVFHVQGLPIVILGVRAHDVQQQEAIDLQALNVNRNNVHVLEVPCTLNDQFELDIDQPNDLGLYHDYQNNNADNFLNGDLVQVPNAENVHNTLNQVMNDDWQNRAQHLNLFRGISGILMPLMGAINVNSKDKFRSILHGAFYASDNPYKVLVMYKVGQKYSLKRGQEEEGERPILTRITEQRLDLLLLRQSTENAPDPHPIVYVLEFANNAEEVGQRLNGIRPQIEQFMKIERGYLPITPEDEIVFCPVVLNVAAQRAEELITIPENLYIHRLNRHDALRRVEPQQPVRLVEPEGVIDESPPANLLSDVTIQNLRNYRQNVRQEDQRKEKILFFQQGDNDNQCIEVRLHECSKENAIRKRIRSSAHAVQDILARIRGILDNQLIEVSDLLTLEFATSTGYYDYWLQEIDIVRAARLQYQLRTEGNRALEVVNLARDNQQMFQALDQFRRNEERQRLTLIITLNNTHWVTLVIERQNENYVGYYADSSGGNVPDDVAGIVRNNLGDNVTIENVSVYQQTDGHNCGLWALENARDINQVLNPNHERQIENITDAIKEQLRRDGPNRNENYFRGLRSNIAQLFRDNPQDNVQLQAYHDNKGRIDPLLRTYLELGYHRVGGGYGLGEAPISLSVSDFSDLPQSSLESPEASHVSNLSKGKVGR